MDHVKARQLKTLPLVATMFFCVSGGAYGLEPAVMLAGNGMALVLILVTPILWALPSALMTAELATAMPVEGGYTVWVKEALGPFWGFLCGWWTWVYSWVDVSIYPVLASEYAATFLRNQFGITALEDRPILKWLVALGLIAIFTGLNIRGTKVVGHTSTLFGFILLAPFLAFVGIGLWKLWQQPVNVWQPFVPPGETPAAAFGAGLYVVIWNYLGWDSMSTVAAEVENPRRAYPLALAICLPLITAMYFLPTLVGLAAVPDRTQWVDGSWPTIAEAVGGPWLGVWISFDGFISLSGLFMATMLAASRIPYVLTQDGYLPKRLMSVHPRFGTPWLAILLCAGIYSVLTWSTFADLVKVNVIVYSAALFLEFVALLVLRRKRPEMERPFRIPGGWPVLWLILLVPVALLSFGVTSEFTETLRDEGLPAALQTVAWTAGALATGPLWYLGTKALRRRAAG